MKVTRPGKWGNPFHVEEFGREEAMARFRAWFAEQVKSGALDPSELRGKNLACWCRADEECHADTLLRAASRSKR